MRTPFFFVGKYSSLILYHQLFVSDVFSTKPSTGTAQLLGDLRQTAMVSLVDVNSQLVKWCDGRRFFFFSGGMCKNTGEKIHLIFMMLYGGKLYFFKIVLNHKNFRDLNGNDSDTYKCAWHDEAYGKGSHIFWMAWNQLKDPSRMIFCCTWGSPKQPLRIPPTTVNHWVKMRNLHSLDADVWS